MRKPRVGAERGASILELAFVVPVMAVLVLGVLDLGRAYQLQLRAEAAAREGATYAQIHPNSVTCSDRPDIVGRVVAEEAGLSSRPGFAVSVLGQDAGGTFVPLTGCDGDIAQPGERVRVEVEVTFDVVTPMIERIVGETILLTGAAEVRVQG